MSREEDKRLYESKKCIYNGEIIDTYLVGDYDFVESELIACKDPKSLEATEKALTDTARTIDSLTTEKRELEAVDGESVEPSTFFQDGLNDLIGQVKGARLLNRGKGFITWFYPCTNFIDVSELQDKMLPPMNWLIDDLLPLGGAVMISAKPKMGKTFLALQMSLSVASGDDFLGFQGHKHEVLYIDFESSQRAIKTRLSMMTENAPRGFFLMTPKNALVFGNIGNGFEEQVNFFLQEHKGVKLVIVDIYGKIQGDRQPNKNIYKQEYTEISNLDAWARDKGITLVLIHHQNKQADYENPMQGISGSTGLLGGLQAFFILSKRDYTDNTTKLTVGGKEIMERDIFIQPTSEDNRTWIEVEPEDRPSRKKTVSISKITMVIRDLCIESNEVEIKAKELSDRVDMTPREVGLWLNRYEGELAEYQGIAFTKKHTKEGTIYTIRIEQ